MKRILGNKQANTEQYWVTGTDYLISNQWIKNLA